MYSLVNIHKTQLWQIFVACLQYIQQGISSIDIYINKGHYQQTSKPNCNTTMSNSELLAPTSLKIFNNDY